MTEEKTTSEISDMAVTMLRTGGDTTFDKAVYDNSISKWLPFMEHSINPLDPAVGEKMMGANEVFKYFKEVNPEDPYKAFIAHITMLGPTQPGVSRLDHILRSIKMLSIGKKLAQIQ